ncbi:MAG: hypothetical protein L0Z53_13100, partial [Acidobacteriales bacterium]|nr:hypothetical protein [Terriglobales bacterium]
QMVAEQIASVRASNVAPVTVTDCAGVVFNVNTAGAAGPNGAGALLIAAGQPRAGEIDWNGQNFGAVPFNYAMRYTACGAGGARQQYEVRWNIINLFQLPGPPVHVGTKLVTVSARRRDQPRVGGGGGGTDRIAFSTPVTIRTIVGQ